MMQACAGWHIDDFHRAIVVVSGSIIGSGGHCREWSGRCIAVSRVGMMGMMLRAIFGHLAGQPHTSLILAIDHGDQPGQPGRGRKRLCAGRAVLVWLLVLFSWLGMLGLLGVFVCIHCVRPVYFALLPLLRSMLSRCSLPYSDHTLVPQAGAVSRAACQRRLYCKRCELATLAAGTNK
jgi:hypothetical protein